MPTIDPRGLRTLDIIEQWTQTARAAIDEESGSPNFAAVPDPEQFARLTLELLTHVPRYFPGISVGALQELSRILRTHQHQPQPQLLAALHGALEAVYAIESAVIATSTATPQAPDFAALLLAVNDNDTLKLRLRTLQAIRRLPGRHNQALIDELSRGMDTATYSRTVTKPLETLALISRDTNRTPAVLTPLGQQLLDHVNGKLQPQTQPHKQD